MLCTNASLYILRIRFVSRSYFVWYNPKKAQSRYKPGTTLVRLQPNCFVRKKDLLWLSPCSYHVITNAGVKAHFLSPAKQRKGGHGNTLVMMKYEWNNCRPMLYIFIASRKKLLPHPGEPVKISEGVVLVATPRLALASRTRFWLGLLRAMAGVTAHRLFKNPNKIQTRPCHSSHQSFASITKSVCLHIKSNR